MKTILSTALLGLLLAAAAPAGASDDAAAATAATAATALPGKSLYHLQATLTDQHGQSLQWSALQGRPQLVSMFYANCHLMCPLILENAKLLQKQLPAAERQRLDVAIITWTPLGIRRRLWPRWRNATARRRTGGS